MHIATPTPASYEALLIEARPTKIETDADYDRIRARFGDLMVKKNRNEAEQELYLLLRLLIEDYDRRNAMPLEGCSPAELLQFLVDESGKKADELLKPVFRQRSHIHEALTGKRPISAAQARKLGHMFHLQPGVFIR
jgi:HTH-type transcriptional regulator/antitoxin HigA